jgi:hypothetical protein
MQLKGQGLGWSESGAETGLVLERVWCQEESIARKRLAALCFAFRFSLEIYRQLAVPQPKGADFIVDHRLIIPNYYRGVLAQARQHQSNVTAIPRFEIATKPLRFNGLGWEPLVRVTTAVEGMAAGGEDSCGNKLHS